MAHKLVMDVDGTGYRTLTTTESKILSVALENYRKNRAAQKMLDGQAQKNKTESAKVYQTYDRILAAITSLQQTLE